MGNDGNDPTKLPPFTYFEGPWPTESELQRVRKKLSRTRGHQKLRPGATLLDRAKYELCKQFVIYRGESGISQRELAKRLGINESRVSEVLRYHIHKLTLDRLIKYLEKIRPGAKVKIT